MRQLDVPDSVVAAVRRGVCWSVPVLLVSILLFTSPILAQSHKGKLSVRQEDGFGRLVLKLDEMPSFSHTLEDGILTLSFSEPIDVDVNQVAGRLSRYIGIARRDPDGRALRFALTRQYRVNLMAAGDQLFVDILPRNWVGLPPPLPEHVVAALANRVKKSDALLREQSRQRREAQKDVELKVRVARFPTFSRITFDWNRFTTVKLTRDGKEVRLAFDAITDVDLGLLETDPPLYVQKVSHASGPEGIEINLQVSPEATLRGFREGLDYVVDLSGPDYELDLAAKTLSDKLNSESVVKEGVKAGSGDRKKGEIKISGRDEPRVSPDQREISIDGDSLKTSIRPFDLTSAGPADFGDWKLELTGNREAKTVAEKNSTMVAVQKNLEQGADRQVKVVPQENIYVPTEDDDARIRIPLDHGTGIKVDFIKVGDSIKLMFPFEENVASAAFRRENVIWLVFDSSRTLDFSEVIEKGKNIISRVERYPLGSSQLVQLHLHKPGLIYTSRQNRGWVVHIGNMITGESTPLKLNRRLRSDKRSIVTIDYRNAGRVHWIDDKEIGDRVAVVTAQGPAKNISKPQSFVEFQALPTSHGIAIRPNTDDLAVRLIVDEVIITRGQGLTLSPGEARQYQAGRKSLKPANNSRIGFLDLQNWQGTNPRFFEKNLSKIERSIATAEKKHRNALRMKLAKLYMSHQLIPETLAVLKLITESDPGAQSDPALNILRGAARVLMGYSKEAEKDLNVHALAHDPDAALWRGLLSVDQYNWTNALKNFRTGADVVPSYPATLQVQFRLAAALAAIELRELNRAADELDAIQNKQTTVSLAARNQLIRGRYLEAIGRTEEAIEAYDNAKSKNNRSVEAEAEYRRINLLVNTEKLAHSQAVKALERLSLIWRGDDTELRALRLLGNLYVYDKNYRSAFDVMKNAIKAFPNDQLAHKIQDEMKEVFVGLFLHDDAQDLEPIEALSLYYDYRELTPIGRMGDELIRQLANRLIDVDLLDQAAELLDHQVNKRLSGVARAQVATRLALVHLMNRKPVLALRAIRHTRQPDLPHLLRKDRDILEARALGDIGRVEGAIDILNRLKGEEIERLKADALWTAQKWLPAGQQIEKLLDQRWQDSEPLTDRERFDVLRAAISYVLGQDQFALDRLRKKFYAKMVKSPDAEAFVLVSNPVVGKNMEFEKLAKEIASVDTLNSFMKKFRLRYNEQPFITDTSEGLKKDGKGSLG